MKLLNLKLRIGPRLAMGFGVLIVLLIATAAVGLYSLTHGNDLTRNIVEKEWVKVTIANNIMDQADANQMAAIVLSLTKDPATRTKMKAEVEERVKKITAYIEDLEGRLYKAEGKAIMAKLKEERVKYVQTFKKSIALGDAGKFDDARAMAANEVPEQYENMEAHIRALIALQTKLVDDAGDDAQKNFVLSRNVSIGLGLLALVLGSLLALFTTRHITNATGQLASTVAKVAAGDSSARSEVKSGDELEDLSSAFDTMVAERVAALAQKEKESEAVNNSFIEVMRAVSKLSRGDLTVKAPVREDITGALADAINSMTESTAKTLAGVTGVSNEVRSASQDGRDTVLSTAKGMNEIRGTIQETGKRIKRLGERSQEITGIVKLIDDIAERTSVLALNANMQAAMAGEAGRGFRVVADEVQRLAERSKEATDQIAKLVTNIQSETNDTMATMDRAIGEVVKGGELAEKAAAQVTHLDELGGTLLESMQAFTLPEEFLKEGRAAASGNANRRAA